MGVGVVESGSWRVAVGESFECAGERTQTELEAAQYFSGEGSNVKTSESENTHENRRPARAQCMRRGSGRS